jgi:uncharacterized protein (TIGR02145 family)
MINLIKITTLLFILINNFSLKPTNNNHLLNINDSTINEVIIGKQIWANKNLDVDTFRNGDKIPQAKNEYDWQKSEPKWCYFDDKESNGIKSGKIYNYYAISDPRGLAPVGWRVPSIGDWQQLISYLGGIYYAGKDLKSTTAWGSSNKNSTNKSGFNAVPSGCRAFNSEYVSRFTAYWWTSTPYVTCQINGNASWVIVREDNSQKMGCSVRLIKE